MKKNVLSLLSFIIFLFGVISCEEPEEVTCTDDACPLINFQINIENNTDSQIDVKIMSVMFGKTDYNENIHIHKNEDEYNEYFTDIVPPSDSNYTGMLEVMGYKEYISGSNIYVDNDVTTDTKQFIDEEIKINDKHEKIDFHVYDNSAESILVEIKFANGEVCYLAGWPEYYNDVIKLENVKKFGFFYDLWIDKKVSLYCKDENNRNFQSYFFDESGNIEGGYLSTSSASYLINTSYYPMNITINSVDDIQLEISELTEVEPDETGNEITE